MKTGDQIKIIFLSLLSVVVMVGVITMVSLRTTEYVKSHHAEGAHGTEHASGDHGDKAGHDSEKMASTSHKSEEHKSEEHKSEEHKSEEHKSEEHKSEEHKSEETKVAPVVAKADLEAGKQVFLAKTCTACHMIDGVDGAVGAIGPKLNGLGERAATRVPGQDAITYIKASIDDPNGYVVEGYAPAMPQLRSTMSDEEYDNLVAYLASL